ncbi:MAG: DUF4105 domain-containing protein [Gemmatimonadaceae bacterium]|nr:DUF4105 domain-containing protein [Gemmatimonadaceae bacterium]
MALSAAQAAPLPAQEPGATLEISVLTFGQGDAVFERFGHNALRVRDTSSGLDLAYNWGMFSFEQPNFLGRFLSGDTQYWVEAFPTEWLVQIYAGQDRQTVEQVLELTPAQRAQLAQFVATNARDENKFYRYDYFLDNCSTRLRDAIDVTLGGALKRRFSTIRTEWTFRSEAVRLTAGDGLAQAGIDIALGTPADAAMSAWQAMYVPMRLRDFLRDVTVPGEDGSARPLVRTERVLHEATRAPEAAERRGLSIGAWGPVLGAWMLLLAPLSAVARRRTRVPAAVMAALFYAVSGILGLLLLGMWVGSAHVFWYGNYNLLLFSPLALVAAVLAPRAILRGELDTLARRIITAVVVMAALTLLLAPMVRQALAGPLLLALPAHLGLAIAIWRHTRPLPPAPVAEAVAGARVAA